MDGVCSLVADLVIVTKDIYGKAGCLSGIEQTPRDLISGEGLFFTEYLKDSENTPISHS